MLSVCCAEREMANRRIVLNAKMRGTGVCGAAETLLVDRAVAGTLVAMLLDAGCEGAATSRREAPLRRSLVLLPVRTCEAAYSPLATWPRISPPLLSAV